MPVPWKLLGVFALVLIIAAGTWKVQDWRYGKQLADRDAIASQSIEAAGRIAREEEQRRQLAINKEASDAREQLKSAVDDAVTADAVGDRLRTATKQFAASTCSGDTGTAQRGASASRAAMVLSDLFQRADKRAGELAAAYDRARIAGLACERSYGSLTRRENSQKN